jgi:hypothetical protein
MLSRVFEYFALNAEDKNIKAVMDETLQLMNMRVNWIVDIFNKEKRVIPMGYSEEDDVCLEAPRLYQDVFYLYYLRNMIKVQLATNSLFLTTSVRADVREMYHQYNQSCMELYEKVTDIMLSKGILVKPPYINTLNQVDFLKEQNFLTGFLGKKRPLLALEISSLHYLVITNFIGKTLLQGFKQVAQAKPIRDYMDRGIKLTSKIMDTYESMLAQENIPQSMFWDSMVTDSTVAPFSDKLMLSHVSYLNAAGFLNIGAAMSTSLRHDVSASYLKTLADIMSYAEDGVNLMIENGWLEEPPRHIDQREIENLKH